MKQLSTKMSLGTFHALNCFSSNIIDSCHIVTQPSTINLQFLWCDRLSLLFPIFVLAVSSKCGCFQISQKSFIFLFIIFWFAYVARSICAIYYLLCLYFSSMRLVLYRRTKWKEPVFKFLIYLIFINTHLK